MTTPLELILRKAEEDAQGDRAPHEIPPGRVTRTMSMVPEPVTIFRYVGPGDIADDADAHVERAGGSSGAPLPDDVRARFEQSLDADLSRVRVHTGGASAAAARAVGARAYAQGHDIHFADGAYAPGDPFGLHLLAHEVAHTVQHTGGTAHRKKIMRETAPAAGAAAALTFGGDLTLGESSAGPFALKLKGKYEANAKAGADGKTNVEGGAKAGPDQAGVAAAVKTELEKQMIGDIQIKPELKGSAELTTKGGKVQFGIAGKAKAGPIDIGTLKADLTIAKWEPGKPPQVLVAGLGFDLPVAKYEIDAGGGGKFSVDAKVTIAVEISPDYAKIAEWLLEDLGAAGAADLAITMGASLAPLLCLASALQMASDEADLAKKVTDYARDGQHAALCLATATMGSDMAATTPAQQQAIAKGKGVAQQASGKCGLDAYKASFTSEKAGQITQQCDRQARGGYETKVREMAEQLYKSSILQRIWKTQEDVTGAAMKVLNTAWP